MRYGLLVVGDANPDVVLTGVPPPIAFAQRERLVGGAALTVGGSGAITACGAARPGGRDLAASLRLAAACGALSTRAAGGTAARPTMAEAPAAAGVEED